MKLAWRLLPILLLSILMFASPTWMQAQESFQQEGAHAEPVDNESSPNEALPMEELSMEEVPSGKVQEFTGSIRVGDFFYYLIPDLKQGEALTVYAESLSGNLDPIVGLLVAEVDTEAAEAGLIDAFQSAVDSGDDPLVAINEARDQLFLIWDDDGGGGLSSTFDYVVPAGGDFRLVVANALTGLHQGTGFGRYRLLLGIDAPQVSTGDALPTGDVFSELDREISPASLATEDILDTLPPDQIKRSYELQDMQPGDTFYAWIESTSGDLRPTLILRSYADKPVRSANLGGEESSVALEYTLVDNGNNFQLDVEGCCDESPSSGDYRLLLGVNAPEIASGTFTPSDRTVVETPTPVAIGIKLQQIVEVNESNEFFTVVATMQMEWTDKALAFNPDECQCLSKTFTGPSFSEFLTIANNRWPDFTLFNQQGNRWTQNRASVINSDGTVIYFERFTTNLQVDFDFTRYPFDSQTFPIKVDSVFPESMYYFTELADYTEIDPDHGEDEFIISGFETEVTSQQASTRSKTSRFTLSYTSPRHLEYYMLQIFIPILLIIGVSWVTFFLRDYGRRIEVASANLLLFIAFSFSLADNYPRLGYVTFLDAIMATIFVVNALVVVYNVWLKRMEMQGREVRAERIDNVLDWAYPTAYAVAILTLIYYFFW